MKLIHCSDLHLDSKMETHLTAEQAAQRNRELCTTFARMVTYAVQNGVTAVMIAGDLFDTERVTRRTADFVLDTIAGASNIDFLYLRGNHDESRRAFTDRQLPDNLLMFGDEWSYYRYDSVVIAGIELTRANCETYYDTLSLEPQDRNIVMLHGQESASVGEELVCTAKLRDKHIDYLALGHLHSCHAEPLDYRGTWCYCGCLEGRGFDECGQKGFVLYDTDTKTHQFVPFAARTLYELPVDITGLRTVSEIRRAIETAADGLSPDSLVRFVLTGDYGTETQKDIRFLTDIMQQRFFFAGIKDESRFAVRAEDYSGDISLKGEFIRCVLASDHSDEEKAQMIRCGIQALSGEEIVL